MPIFKKTVEKVTRDSNAEIDDLRSQIAELQMRLVQTLNKLHPDKPDLIRKEMGK